MESRLIFESNKTYIRKVQWEMPSSLADSEWIYIGITNNDIKKDIIFKILDDCFAKSEIYLSNERTNSFSTTVAELKARIDEFVGVIDFVLWDLTFHIAVQFNHIGVLRHGKTASH